MKPLSKKQMIALRHAEGGRLWTWGRGSKQSMDGLVQRGLVDRARLSFRSGENFWGYLTEAGKKVAEGLTSEGRRCPDGGACHHGCQPVECFRVQTCGPLSEYGEDWKPEDVEVFG